MKQIISIIISLFCAVSLFAQPAPSRGNFGTNSGYQSTQMNKVRPSGVAVSGTDTLVNGDTGVTFIWIGNNYSASVELLTTTLTGTVATTSNILYGFNNNGTKLTAAQAATLATGGKVNGGVLQAITGNTTYCAGCVGASSTTVPGASLKYTWQIPYNAGALFDNLVLRTIQTGTATATYSGRVQSQY